MWGFKKDMTVDVHSPDDQVQVGSLEKKMII